MGKEARCRGTFEGVASEGKALLETDHVLWRGENRLKLPLADIKSASVSNGVLKLGSRHGALALDLGADAPKWLDAIRNPKTRADKLGVKADQRASLLGVTDPALAGELEARGADVSTRLRKESDVVFLQIDEPEGLARIADVVPSLAQTGAVWVVTPRGVAGLKDTEVMAAAKKAGLVDVKVVRFSDSHSANKFVIPVAKRR